MRAWFAALSNSDRIAVYIGVPVILLAALSLLVGYLTWRDGKRGRERSLLQRLRDRMPWKQAAVDVLPYRWGIAMAGDQASVFVTVYIVNYLQRVVTVDDVEVLNFRADGTIGFESIVKKLRLKMPPHSYFAVTVQRLLADHEARQVRAASPQAEWRASFGARLVWRARWRSNQETWPPLFDSVIGRVVGHPTQVG